MKIGDRVDTEHGPGEIVDVEHYSRINGGINRYGVKLDSSPFFYPVAYYWPAEIRSIS